ncbi:tRNA (N6-isopentenyl adenosine(37)-C2)-methylthiotransferase MiaB [Sediminibacterium sp. TEGAF015]|uniref:tRNA (N6-isopentenyl adenosine(37)-C2)-methylthiotransferase MiaB n=1 Tax=Sediminibacterium sp. TEGAF015 TaxID=575378 RepID=UPI00220089C5|nr:tRNA (N6-isopentenyl adenosine(37)-C2)-methylthiotransferase MiaB [Sediminibacterium sp. TEGAF015]BDQ11186.1 tRNA-2-methylthio-N(6)-dimethylallyladenosine synthase [Sediminibacterium sp. TEGAF015]
MELAELMNKTHDESRQGEAFQAAESPADFQKKFYIESYGCAMNFSDSEVVAAILQENQFSATPQFEMADLVLINTCSIREKAEQTIRKRLTEFRKVKKTRPGMLIGVLGCMAERLKAQLLEQEKLVDLVIGPDAYRSLPALIEEASSGQKGVNVLLSREETYGDISPVRLNSNGITAFVSITRGCNNMCSFCVVPFTRGRERSRSADSIIQEIQQLVDTGYKEVTLLGQNVDSYYWEDEEKKQMVTFANLLEMAALVSPELRIRFSTSHPKDITDDVLITMAKYENICKCIHLPVQSGSTRLLQLMNRTYSREWYLAKVDRIRELLPDCGITSDMIAGFCTETEEDHKDTLSLMDYCGFDMSYMYFYSERPGTLAARRFKDDISLEVKKRRLQEIVDKQGELSTRNNQRDIGKTFKILIEADSKRDSGDWTGRTSQNKITVFPKSSSLQKPGDYVWVNITDCTRATLLGKIVDHP